MSPTDSGKSQKRAKQRAKRERAALLRLLRKSVKQQVRLAYAKVPKEASALSQARLDMRASLVSHGYLTVEELESLPKRAAIAIRMSLWPSMMIASRCNAAAASLLAAVDMSLLSECLVSAVASGRAHLGCRRRRS